MQRKLTLLMALVAGLAVACNTSQPADENGDQALVAAPAQAESVAVEEAAPQVAEQAAQPEVADVAEQPTSVPTSVPAALGRPDAPAAVQAGFRSDSAALVGATGRPQFVEFFTYW